MELKHQPKDVMMKSSSMKRRYIRSPGQTLLIPIREHRPYYHRGASMVEFIIVAPLLVFMALGIMQFGLIYHAKSILNYATFEAARTGAVNNAQIDVMRKEFGYRMAPIFGGSGSLRDGVNAVVRSVVIAQDPTATKIDILNPTPASYAIHGERKSVVDSHGTTRSVLAIPNTHLRFRDPEEIKQDGLNIQDANLLKIRVTYGFQMRLPFLDMEIPGIKWVMRSLMVKHDPDNWMFYMRGMLPIKATATVRMQSEAWDSQLQPEGERMFDSVYNWRLNENGEPNKEVINDEEVDDDEIEPSTECVSDTDVSL